jgi:hypothetical protein
MSKRMNAAVDGTSEKIWFGMNRDKKFSDLRQDQCMEDMREISVKTQMHVWCIADLKDLK